MVLSVALLGLFWAVIAYQLTSPDISQRVLRRTIAALNEIDAIWPTAHQQLVEEAQSDPNASLAIPDFPVRVTVNSQEVLNSSSAQLKTLVLARSATQVYEDGTKAFTSDPEATRDLGLFSPQGAVHRGISFLTHDAHQALRLLVIALSVVSFILMLSLLSLTRAYGRITAVGISVTLAALTSLLVTTTLRLILDSAASRARDYIIADLLTVGKEIVEVALRSSVIFSLLGLALVIMGLALNRLTLRTLSGS